MTIPFIDLETQRNRIRDDVSLAIRRVVEHGQFIMGPEVGQFEAELAARTGAAHVVACSNGTDALVMAFRSLGVQPGDAVIVPTFTFAATAEAVVLAGGVPVFADVFTSTFNLDAGELTSAVAAAEATGLRPVGVVPVDLFGQPADYPAISAAAADLGLWIVADAAQSVGAALNGRAVGALAPVSTASFFPAKPLGCFGDGGAVFTDDDDLAARLRSIRVHGQGTNKYDNVRIGMNARLDTIQAAVLLEKLRIFDDELQRRDEVAKRYSKELAEVVRTPELIEGATSSWAQYTIVTTEREALAAALKEAGVPTVVYYPKPLHTQDAYCTYPRASALERSAELSAGVLSLPMHPYLDEETQARIADAVLRLAETRST